MVARRRSEPQEESSSRRAPATTPEGRERQLTSLAYDLAEKQLREGTASAQVITQFLKTGSSRERIEQRKLEAELRLTEAKIQQIASVEKIEKLYSDAISAMRSYGGDLSKENEDDYPEDFEAFADRY